MLCMRKCALLLHRACQFTNDSAISLGKSMAERIKPLFLWLPPLTCAANPPHSLFVSVFIFLLVYSFSIKHRERHNVAVDHKKNPYDVIRPHTSHRANAQQLSIVTREGCWWQIQPSAGAFQR